MTETQTSPTYARVFHRDQLAAWDLPGAWADDAPKILHREQVDTRRWVSVHELIFRAPDDGKTYRVSYEQGLTENQDDTDPWNYRDHVVGEEVERHEQTVTAWRRITDRPTETEPSAGTPLTPEELATVTARAIELADALDEHALRHRERHPDGTEHAAYRAGLRVAARIARQQVRQGSHEQDQAQPTAPTRKDRAEQAAAEFDAGTALLVGEQVIAYAAAIQAATRREDADRITALGKARGWSTWAADFIHPDREFVDPGTPEDPCHPCGCPKRFNRHADGCAEAQ
jgi:predicted nuclease with RNAse H fold